MILSAQFWPSFKEEKLRLPEYIWKHLKKYTTAFESLKGNRTLVWKPHLGNVDLEIELKERTLQLSVSPVHATILWHFQDKRELIFFLFYCSWMLSIFKIFNRNNLILNWKQNNLCEYMFLTTSSATGVKKQCFYCQLILGKTLKQLKYMFSSLICSFVSNFLISNISWFYYSVTLHNFVTWN